MHLVLGSILTYLIVLGFMLTWRSTLIAAEQTGRNALLMELDPRFCDVVVKRWEDFTGRKAERVAESEVAEEGA